MTADGEVVDHLSVEDLLEVAAGIVDGVQVQDLGLLASAAARPRTTVFGADAYPSFPDKVAALMHSLARNHPLVDGSKRLAWSAGRVLCLLNGFDLVLDVDRAEALVVAIAVGEVEVPEIAAVVVEALQQASGGGVLSGVGGRVPAPLDEEDAVPTRTTPWPAGTPCWIDLASTDLPAARTFYAEVFGWHLPEGVEAFGGYASAEVDGSRVAGVGATMQEGQPAAWLSYFATDDVEASVAAAREAGGTVHMGPDQVGPLGSLAVLADPTGAVFGLWQAGEHPGVERYNEHGSLIWNEAVVADPARARDFYTALFGWAWDPIEGMETYQTFRLGDRWLGGLGGGADSPVQGWGVCFAVRDTDATVADVTARGGTVLIPAQDSPYGRYAVVADPQGAAFSLMQAGDEAA